MPALQSTQFVLRPRCRAGPFWPTSAWASPAWRWARCCTATASRTTRRAGRRRTASRTFAPKAKSVIWLFMIGGVSHLESFDPKPALNKYAGKTIAETPYKDVLDKSFYRRERPRRSLPIRATASADRSIRCRSAISKRGQSGIEVSDWWPHVGDVRRRPGRRPLDVDRTTTTTAPSCSSTPAGTSLDGYFPTIGSWVHYGLGSLNDNLPQFVVLGTPLADCCGGMEGAPGQLSRPGARRRAALARSEQPAALRPAGRGRVSRRAAGASSSCSAS